MKRYFVTIALALLVTSPAWGGEFCLKGKGDNCVKEADLFLPAFLEALEALMDKKVSCESRCDDDYEDAVYSCDRSFPEGSDIYKERRLECMLTAEFKYYSCSQRCIAKAIGEINYEQRVRELRWR